MTILLDTCAAIWLVADARVSTAAVNALQDARRRDEPIFVSPITGWEIGLLAARGRFASPLPPRVWFDRLLAVDGVVLDELPPSVLIDSSSLPGHPPRDPSDRIFIAAARERGHAIMTRDDRILDYGKAGHVRTIGC
ncbi:MAG TPA: type II toxin-antitoxin system VapC family toxin [Bauldia sp.]|nr:type II toxin-antitoxin system VapC family toxin [Bauldia sp.]